MGGGLLIWGVNPETNKVEGVKLATKEREAILKEVQSWPVHYEGGLLLKSKFVEVQEDPFNPSDVEDLHALIISVEISLKEEKLFWLKVK